jgi:hypothetical protein
MSDFSIPTYSIESNGGGGWFEEAKVVGRLAAERELERLEALGGRFFRLVNLDTMALAV